MNDGGWIKAKRSYGHGECVEMKPAPDECPECGTEGVYLRDSKNPGAVLHLHSKAAFATFLEQAKRGDYDHLA